MIASPDQSEGRPSSETIVTVMGVEGRAISFTERGLSGLINLPLPQIDLVEEQLFLENNSLELAVYRERQERGEVKPRRGLVIARIDAAENEGQLEFWFNRPLRELGRKEEVEEIGYINGEIAFKLKGEARQRDFGWMWNMLRRYPIEKEATEITEEETAGLDEGKKDPSEMSQAEIEQWFRRHRGGRGRMAKEAVEMLIKSDRESREE